MEAPILLAAARAAKNASEKDKLTQRRLELCRELFELLVQQGMTDRQALTIITLPTCADPAHADYLTGLFNRLFYIDIQHAAGEKDGAPVLGCSYPAVEVVRSRKG